jgi:hypothetical protein
VADAACAWGTKYSAFSLPSLLSTLYTQDNRALCLFDLTMVNEQAGYEKSILDFFLRSGLTSRDLRDCLVFIKQSYPDDSISPVPVQGYCSFTVFVGDALVIQFRPHQYRLDLRVTAAARSTYGFYAPLTKYVSTMSPSGLLVYSMERIRGISLKEFMDKSNREDHSFEKRAKLCKDFAIFLSQAWSQGNADVIQKGTVGGSILSRLKILRSDLPVRFKSKVMAIVDQLPLVEALPWVLSHGDIVPGNIMVEPASGSLLGLVDWAEAEFLPFGVCLYGLEELLGEITATGFRYYADASDLRNIFWDAIIAEIPELRQVHVLEAVTIARDLGVLLWYGIAFDNGAINRVVQEGRDVNEIKRLNAFLNLQCPRVIERASKI